MAPDVMHGNQRYPQTVGHALGKTHRHQHGADKAGGVGHRHGVDVLFRKPRMGKSLIREARNGLHMLAGGDLRHHAAVEGVHIRLRKNGVGQHSPAVPHHRHGGLVAGGFKGQYVHASASS